jgi:N-acyl-D-aspartate/D-glutamate deacylase
MAGQVLDAERGTKFTADIAVNYAQGNRLAKAKQPDGKITEVGDLSVLGAKQTISAANCVVLPGRIALLEDGMLGRSLYTDFLDSILSAGVTTVVGIVPADDRAEIERITSKANLPVNWGFVVRANSGSTPRAAVFEQLSFAASQGALAIIADRFEPSTREELASLSIPLVKLDKLPMSGKKMVDLARQSRETFDVLGLNTQRGRIRRDFFADLQLIDENSQSDRPPYVPYCVRRLLVAGETVWENGKRTGSNPGVFLRGR